MGDLMKRYRTDWMLRGTMAICMLFAGYVSRGSAQEDPRLWTAGPYSFSDELGGFIIRSISGTGTMQDPIILTEEFPSVTPTTLIIRTEKIAQLNPSEDAGILFYLRVRATNSSGHPWVEFEFELQEQLNVPSDYGDGLSFYQPGDKRGMIKSTGYGTFSDDFEPYDRMVFRDGKIDPGFGASFDFPIADFTPKRVFYLVQEPRIPSS
jgi:hypothetical protein